MWAPSPAGRCSRPDRRSSFEHGTRRAAAKACVRISHPMAEDRHEPGGQCEVLVEHRWAGAGVVVEQHQHRDIRVGAQDVDERRRLAPPTALWRTPRCWHSDWARSTIRSGCSCSPCGCASPGWGPGCRAASLGSGHRPTAWRRPGISRSGSAPRVPLVRAGGSERAGDGGPPYPGNLHPDQAAIPSRRCHGGLAPRTLDVLCRHSREERSRAMLMMVLLALGFALIFSS
jgi:hypothetical protein